MTSVKRLSDGLFKGRQRKPRAQRKADAAASSSDDGEVWDEEFARSCSEDGELSSYSLNDDNSHQEKPKSIKSRLSGGLFKHNRKTRKERRKDNQSQSGSSDDEERVYDEDDVSSTSFASVPMKRPVANRSLNADSNHSTGNNPKWSIAADKTITTNAARDAASASSMVDEIDDEEDSDLYTSDDDEEKEKELNNGGVVSDDTDAIETDGAQQKTEIMEETAVTAPLSPTPHSPVPSVTSHSEATEGATKPKSKKKKIKAGPGALDAHFAKTKKKKKKTGSSQRSLKSTKSAKSAKSTKSTKSKKKVKSKKTLEAIESQEEFQSFAEIDKAEAKKSKKLKSSKKPKSKKKAAAATEQEDTVGDLSPKMKNKQSSIWMLQDKIRHSLMSLTDSFISTDSSQNRLSSSQRNQQSQQSPSQSSRKLPSFSFKSPSASHKVSQPPMSPCIPENEVSESDHYYDEDEQPAVNANQKPEDVDIEKIKSDAVSRIKAFALMLGSINNQKEFLEAFHESDSEEEDDDPQPVSKREKNKQKKKFSYLVTELQNFEGLLEKERNERSQERYDMKMKQESVEQLLNEEAEKNVILQAQIDQLQEQLENACEAHQVEEFKAKVLMLEAENELLQQKNQRHEETIASLVKEAEVELKRKAAAGPLEMKRQASVGAVNWTRNAPSGRRRDHHHRGAAGHPEESNEGSMELKMEADDDSTSNHLQQSFGYMSMSSLGARAQGELLQLRSTVQHKDQQLEEQAKEMDILGRELEALREERHVTDLTKHVENLENEKQFFISEIDKLKKELTASQKREQDAVAKAEAAAKESSLPANKGGGGWFGFGGGGGDKEEKNDKPAKDPLDPFHLSSELPKISEEQPTRTVSAVEEETPKRLSNLLDF